MQAVDERFRAICRENGWRFTRQRLAVYSFMRENRAHPGIDEVLKAVRRQSPRVTRESVYRILCEFAAAGLVARLDHLPQARFDCSTAPHGHFICSSCGTIVDFDLPDGFSVPCPVAGAKTSFAEVRVAGICPACAKTASS